MRNWLWLILLFVSIGTEAADQPSPASSLEIAWEPEKEAVSYELEVKPANQTGAPKVYKTKETKFQENLPAGRYLLRIRSVSKDGIKSPWSEAVAVDATPPLISAISPKPGDKIVAKALELPVRLVWSKVPSAQAYQIRIWKNSKEKPEQHVVKTESFTIKTEIGQTYYWTVSLKDKNGVVYEANQKPFSFAIIGSQLETPKIKDLDFTGETIRLIWHQVPNAQTYQLKFFRRDLLEKEWQLVHEETGQNGAEWALQKKLDPGEYRLEVVAHAPSYISSKKLTHRFLVKPKLSELAEIR